MVQRGIYFVRNNILHVKTVEVPWDKDSMEVNKAICSEEIFKSALPFMQPCIDVSSASSLRISKSLSVYGVKDNNGDSIKKSWDILDKSKDIDFMPPGSYDLLYLSCLNNRQVAYILSIGSFYDTYFNSSRKKSSPAIACAALQLLYSQNKVDYLGDMNMFLHWYFHNCQFPVEYCEDRDK